MAWQEVKRAKVLKNLLKEQEKKAGSPEGGVALMDKLLSERWREEAQVPGVVQIEIAVPNQADAESHLTEKQFFDKLIKQAREDGVGMVDIEQSAGKVPGAKPKEGSCLVDKIITEIKSVLEKLLKGE